MDVKIKQLYRSDYLNSPYYATDGSAGFDLIAAIHRSWCLSPGCSVLVPAGFCIEIPKGFFGDVRPRSGLGSKNLVIIPNAPGTIDYDYRGQVMVCLYNLGQEIYTVEPEDRIAQMIIQPFIKIRSFRVSKRLESTERGEKGHGGSGK